MEIVSCGIWKSHKMVRVLILAAIICVCGVVATPTETSAGGRRSPKTTTATTPLPSNSATKEKEIVSMGAEDVERYHPAEVTKPRVLEQIDRRYLDGNFEYKYILSNGVSRHEKSYWTPVGSSKVLARKGYFSYPLPNHKYLTVFYTADENGYHQDSSTYTNHAPVLPRNLDVPEHEFPPVASTTSTTSTTRKPKATRTTRKSWGTTKDFQ